MPRYCSLSTTPRGFAGRAMRAAFTGSDCEQAAAIAVLGTESTERHLVRPSDSPELPVI